MVRVQYAIWLLLLAGCVHWPTRTIVDSPMPRYQVKCGGDCLELNTASAHDHAAFLAKVEEHLRDKRLASAHHLLEQHLDITFDALRQRDAKQPPTEAEMTMARVIDARLKHPADDGWFARLHGKGRGLERAERTVAQAQEFARNQQWKSARDLIQSNQTALAPYPLHAIQANLALAESQRRIGQLEPAAKSWQQAARLAFRWPTPSLWEQIASQRPVPTAWPAEVATNLLPLLPPHLHELPKHATFDLPLVPAQLHESPKNATFEAESLVWFAIGNARLERSEASAALAAFKRADSNGAFPDWDDFLGLYQAKALLALEQAPAATSLLTTLAARPKVRLSALALLGSGKLHEGHTQQAYAFLREAVESSNDDYPCRADAEANWGLTLLTKGDEANGRRWLHSAQKRFEAAQNGVALLQCLENEAAYLVHAGKTDEAMRIRQQIQECELTSSLRQQGRSE